MRGGDNFGDTLDYLLLLSSNKLVRKIKTSKDYTAYLVPEEFKEGSIISEEVILIIVILK